ncbi:MAG: ParB/RepB/Spo0J family partition protein [Alphaproteobacteria bacterium]
MSENDELIKSKKRGLGRGLNALFEDEEGVFGARDDAAGQEALPRGKKQVASVAQLWPGPFQPRQVFDEVALQGLADSIREHGILQPIVVRKDRIQADGYEIIAGERRWRAAQIAQLHEVPIVVLDISDLKALEIAMIENLQRQDLNPLDEARGYQRLMEEFGHTQEKLAKIIGKSRPHIANMVRLLTLPMEVAHLLRDGALSIGHARALLMADNPEALAKDVVAKGLSVRETEILVHESNEKSDAATGDADDLNDAGSGKTRGKSSFKSDSVLKGPDTRALEKELSDRLGMRVTLDVRKGNKGSVKIDYASLDQLDDVILRLGTPSGTRGGFPQTQKGKAKNKAKKPRLLG